MVTVAGLLRDRSGRSKLGCLVMLALFAGGVYYGVEVGGVYLRYWRMVDTMRVQARLGPSLTDDVIRRRLVERARQLNLPQEAQQVRIRRTGRPHEIVITTTWQETLNLPLVQYTVTFRPEARAPL